MPFTFDEMTKAVEEYPANDVDLEIVEVDLPAGGLSPGAAGAFKVRIVNRGPLNLTRVRVHVYGQNGARVSRDDVFISDFVSDEFEPIRGHGGSAVSGGAAFRFRTPNTASATARTLIKVTLDTWNVNLDHILSGHSDPVPEPKATFAAMIAPA